MNYQNFWAKIYKKPQNFRFSFVIPQVEAITESVGDFARERLKEKPSHVVGLENAQWVAMDYGDVLVHIFLPDVREFYDLEHLWEDATLTRIPDLD